MNRYLALPDRPLAHDATRAPSSVGASWRLLVPIMLLLIALVPAEAVAASTQVSVRFTPLSPRSRVSAPIPGIWEIVSNTSELLEGQLQVTLQARNGKQQIVIPDIVITPGTTARFRGMLPPVEIPDNDIQELVQIEMTVQFAPHDGEPFPPEWQQVMFRNPAMQGFNLCVVDPHMAGGTPIDRSYVRHLDFEQFVPDPKNNRVVTTPAHLAPRDMPNEPLAYCAFDLMLSADDGFALLDASQLAAIAKWVKAGGSLCLLPGASLDQTHLAFLNDLSHTAKSDIIYTTDAQGKVSASAASDSGEFAQFNVGLGRAAVRLPQDGTTGDSDGPAWRKAAAFLWKFNATQRQAIEKFGTIDPIMLPQQPANMAEARELVDFYQPTPTLANLLATSPASRWTESLIGRLMPQDFRFVPLWLIGGLLLLFLLVIGPVDYFLLGAFRIRKLTWIYFPLTSFVFAFVTIWIANTYMGVTNETHAYEILDVGDDNTVLRANRIELHYNGAALHFESEFTQALYTPLDTTSSSFRRPEERPQERLPLITGRMPQQFSVVKDIPQWTPQLSRQFWIAPSEKVAAAPKFDFAALRLDDLENPERRSELTSNLMTAFGERCAAYLVTQQQINRILDNPVLFFNTNQSSTGFPNTNERTIPYSPAYQDGNFRPGVISGYGDQIVRMFSIPFPTGMFSVFSQVSPSGGWSIDDLAMADVHDPNQSVLIVAVQRGEDVVIYRKLFRRGQTSP